MLTMVATVKVGARELVQLLKAYTVLLEDLNFDPSMHIKRLTILKGPKYEQNLARDYTRFPLCTNVIQSSRKVQKMLIWVSCRAL